MQKKNRAAISVSMLVAIYQSRRSHIPDNIVHINYNHSASPQWQTLACDWLPQHSPTLQRHAHHPQECGGVFCGVTEFSVNRMQHSIKMAEHSVSLTQHATQNGYLPGRMLWYNSKWLTWLVTSKNHINKPCKRWWHQYDVVRHSPHQNRRLCENSHACTPTNNNSTSLCGDSSETERPVRQRATCTARGSGPVRRFGAWQYLYVHRAVSFEAFH